MFFHHESLFHYYVVLTSLLFFSALKLTIKNWFGHPSFRESMSFCLGSVWGLCNGPPILSPFVCIVCNFVCALLCLFCASGLRECFC